jgi:hypothetical protein
MTMHNDILFKDLHITMYAPNMYAYILFLLWKRNESYGSVNSQGRWACTNTNNPYKVGDGSIFIPDFPRFRLRPWRYVHNCHDE